MIAYASVWVNTFLLSFVIICYLFVIKKVSDGIGHPNNKTSFVGFVLYRVGGSTPVSKLIFMRVRAWFRGNYRASKREKGERGTAGREERATCYI